MSVRKAIFISGGASGIGRAVAQRFAGEGWFVGLGDVDEAGMAETQGLIGSGFSYAHRLDVRDRAKWDEALKSFAMASGGRIDVLINNAGIGGNGVLHEMPVEELDRTLDINLRGMFYGAQAAFPFLRDTAPGSCLLNTASAAGIMGNAGMSVYCATKFGVRGMTESLDAEWAQYGIRVASLCPSFIDTPLLDGTGTSTSNEAIRDKVTRAGLEITPVAAVADAAWAALTDDRLHYPIGKTARRLDLMKRFLPGSARKLARRGARNMTR